MAPTFKAYNESFYTMHVDRLVIWTNVAVTNDGGNIGFEGRYVDFVNDIPLDEIE